MDKASQTGKAIVGKKVGDAEAAVAGAATKLSAIYELPFLSHAPMEPVNCLIHVRPDGAEVWTGTQVPVRTQNVVAKMTGLKPETIVVNTLICGGAFGRRLDIDMIEIAAGFAKQVPYPLKMIWTPRRGRAARLLPAPLLRPDRRRASTRRGKLVGWTHRTTGSSVMARWAPDGLEERARPRHGRGRGRRHALRRAGGAFGICPAGAARRQHRLVARRRPDA